jgi:photosystem II stability/assembly factor-like uncharacterized protein
MATKPAPKKSAAVPPSLLIATRKGLWIMAGDAKRSSWKLSGPHFLGHIVHHAVLDPRDGRTLLVAARTGHLGHTVMRSTNRGRTWTESKAPPVFDAAVDARSVDHVFWLTPGHASEPGVWYAGSSPHGVFRSEDGGDTWAGVDGFNKHPKRKEWCGGDKDGTPDGPKVHSIIVDPRDANHLYISMSSGGTFESTDKGADWKPLNKGVLITFGPDPYPEFGQDPHCVRMHPQLPDRLYQQNHCGMFRLDRPSDTWTDIGKGMPKKVGNIGFPMTLHPRDPDTAWVFPMDGSDVWPRTSPGGNPAVYRTQNGGKTWQRQDAGLPEAQAYWTVKRQAMTHDGMAPLGLYFGTTSGELWGSRNEGESWKCLARHLPHIYAVESAAFR